MITFSTDTSTDRCTQNVWPSSQSATSEWSGGGSET